MDASNNEMECQTLVLVVYDVAMLIVQIKKWSDIIFTQLHMLVAR